MSVLRILAGIAWASSCADSIGVYFVGIIMSKLSYIYTCLYKNKVIYKAIVLQPPEHAAMVTLDTL